VVKVNVRRNKQMARIEIIDKGIGISADNRTMSFHHFIRSTPASALASRAAASV
jgi:signal transduction histidine kinase